MTSTPNIHRCCPICEGDQPMPHWSKASMCIVRCTRCAMLYVDPAPAEMVSGEFYGQSAYHLSVDKLQSDFAPVRFEREIKLFRKFCATGAVLDVGCSTGAFLHRLKTLFGDAYQVTGLDVPGPALDYARSKGIRVIETPFPEHDFGQQRFAAVTFWAVLEHVAQPRLFLQKAADVIQPGGYCFTLVPNMHSLAVRLLGPTYRYVMPEHLNYFTGETLQSLAQYEPRFAVRELRTMHFNPIVIWQDWRRRENSVSEEDRARLLQRTTAVKQNRWMTPAKAAYRMLERLLGAADLADNLALVLERLR